MAKKSGKRNDAEVRRLAAKVAKLQARLEKAEAAKATWKAEAKRFEAEAVKAAKALKKVKKRRTDEARSLHAQGLAMADAENTSAQPGPPDESWTVARLRTSAREAGVPGYSRMTKSALLDSLTRSGEEASPK